MLGRYMSDLPAPHFQAMNVEWLHRRRLATMLNKVCEPKLRLISQIKRSKFDTLVNLQASQNRVYSIHHLALFLLSPFALFPVVFSCLSLL